MKDVEVLSNQPSQSVPVAAEQKPENSVTNEPVKVSYPKPPVLQVDLASLNPDMLKTAEGLGIPLGAIIKYVADLQEYNISVEARLEAIVQNFEPAVQATVAKMVTKAREEQQKQAATVGASTDVSVGTGSNPLSLISQLAPLLQGVIGGAQSDPFAEMAKQWFMEEMTASRAFKKAFDTSVLARLGSKMAAEVVP